MLLQHYMEAVYYIHLQLFKVHNRRGCDTILSTKPDNQLCQALKNPNIYQGG